MVDKRFIVIPSAVDDDWVFAVQSMEYGYLTVKTPAGQSQARRSARHGAAFRQAVGFVARLPEKLHTPSIR
jgi:hypothetical protein